MINRSEAFTVSFEEYLEAHRTMMKIKNAALSLGVFDLRGEDMQKDKSVLTAAIMDVQEELNNLGHQPKLKVDGIPGPKTIAALEASLRVQVVVPVMKMHPLDWIRNEKRTINPKEISGRDKNHPRIQWYLEHCDNIGGFADGKLHPDEVPWCSALPNAAAAACGCEGTKHALASSWDTYPGKSYKRGDYIPEGALVRLRDGNHITCADKGFKWDAKGTFVGLGGNQGNQIKSSTYAKSRIVSVHDWMPLPGVELPKIRSTSGGSVADGDKESTR